MVLKLNRKGMEKSIEMVFVILVTLIVAVVAIKMFIGMAQRTTEAGKEVDVAKAIKECTAYCESNPMAFCSMKFAIDINKDKNVFGAAEYGKYIYVCEDTVPCFILDPNCRSPGYKLDAYGCAKYLCGWYAELFSGDFEKATLVVFGRWKDVNSKMDLLRKYPEKMSGEEPKIYKGDCNTNAETYWWKIFVTSNLKDVQNIYSDERGVLFVVTPEGDELPLCQYLFEGYTAESYGEESEEGAGENFIPPFGS